MAYYIVAKKYLVIKHRKKPTKRQIKLIKSFKWANYRIIKKLPKKKQSLNKLF